MLRCRCFAVITGRDWGVVFMDSLDGIPFGVADLGGWGLLALLAVTVVTMIVKGVLVPRATVDKLLETSAKALEAETRRGDKFEAACDNYRAAIEGTLGSFSEGFAQQIESNTRIVEALQRMGTDDHDDES